MNREECISVEKEEQSLNEKLTDGRKTLIGRVVGKLNMKDQNHTKRQKSLLAELLKPAKYTPILSVQELSDKTNFPVEEVKRLYRAFKQLCPDGIANEETFIEIFEKIYPLGDVTKYARLVFRAMDKDDNYTITFVDFIEYLSKMSYGGKQGKINWAFRFYDVNRDGVISRDEMLKV